MRRVERREKTQKAPQGLEGRLMRYYHELSTDSPQIDTQELSEDIWSAIQRLGSLKMAESQTSVCIEEIQIVLSETNEMSLAQLQDAMGRIESACNIAARLHNEVSKPGSVDAL